MCTKLSGLFLLSSVEPVLQLCEPVFADHDFQIREATKTNCHFIFEEICEFVYAINIYHILSVDSEEQIGIQLQFQII